MITQLCVLDYAYFQEYYKLIAVDLTKQQVLDADPKAMQKINFKTIFFLLEEGKETVLVFAKGTERYSGCIWFNILSE